MKKVKLQHTKNLVLENNEEIILKYYLVQRTLLDPERELYGIQIDKQQGDYTECEIVEGISYSEEDILAMIEKLYINDVTPISMIPIIDDLVTLLEGI